MIILQSPNLNHRGLCPYTGPAPEHTNQGEGDSVEIAVGGEGLGVLK